MGKAGRPRRLLSGANKRSLEIAEARKGWPDISTGISEGTCGLG